jgi:hypothetical protein
MDDATREVFERLCAHVKAQGADATMTRAELQLATGLPKEELMAALRYLHPPGSGQDLQVRFVNGDWDKITLGIGWLSMCEDET